MPRMRVALLSKAFVVGAYQRKCELMAEAAPDLELTLLTPPSWRWGERESVYTPTFVAGYHTRVLPLAQNGNFHLHRYRGLAEALAALRPDLAHLDEEPYNLATWLGLRAAKRVGARPIFFTWQNLYRRYPPPFAWFERAVLRSCALALAGNRDAATILSRKGFSGACRVLPQFGVDEAFFTPATAARADAFTVGFAGRLDPEKGVDVLLRAAAALPGVRVELAGAGPERPALEALAASLGLGGRVRFLGALAIEDLRAFYCRCHALVLPSRARPNWVEQFGRVLIEAMACGTPVVGSQTGEIPNVIGEAGLTFPDGDAEVLAQHLEALQRSPEQQRDLGARGRARVLAHFTMRAIASETVAAYRAVLSSRP